MRRNRSYLAHESFVAPARQTPEIWRLFLGLLLGMFVMMAMNLGLIDVIEALLPPEQADRFFFELHETSTPFTTLVALFSFIFMSLGIFAAVLAVHKRPPVTLFGHAGSAVAGFVVVLKAQIFLYAALYVLPPWDMGDPFVPNLALISWLALLPVSLLAVLIQTSAEEIVFRGYLQQQLAARFSSGWIWMGLPSLLFGIAHYDPTEAGGNAIAIAVWACVFGLLMADLTARSGNLGPAIAVHFITNVSALLITSLPDSLSGLALYTVPYSLSDVDQIRVWLRVDFAIMLVAWIAARLAIRR